MTYFARRFVLFGLPSVVFLLSSISEFGGTEPKEADRIGYQVVADRTNYKANEYATLRFMIINQGSDDLFVSRRIGSCSKWSGHFELQLLDDRGENMLHGGCDAAERPIPDSRLREELNDCALWIRLLPGEIYGTEEKIALPSQKGTYHVRAELWPPGFPARQKQLLKEQNLRVLQSSHLAPLVEINVE